MKQMIIGFWYFISLAINLLLGGCKDRLIDPTDNFQDSLWMPLDNTLHLDVRCITVYNNLLYLTVNQRTDTGNYGYVLYSEDGLTLNILKSFNGFISPMVFHHNYLFVTTSDSILKYHDKTGWESISKLPFVGSESIYDLFFLNDVLYIMADKFWKMNGPNSFQEILYPQRGGKFLVDNSKSVAYFRPWTYASGFYMFNGNTFELIVDGLSLREKISSTVDAMFLKNDTLFAGFGEPASIKHFTNGCWVSYTDSVPIPSDLKIFDPPLVLLPTVASMMNDDLFIGTNYSGVYQWSASKGWVSISKGLPRWDNSHNIYFGINYLVSFNGYLYTGFGQPTFSPYNSGFGVYRIKLSK